MSDLTGQELRKTDLIDCGHVDPIRSARWLEDLAALEHEQWKSWALDIIEIIKMGGYKNLTEELKDKDREWAEHVLWIVKKHLGIKG